MIRAVHQQLRLGILIPRRYREFGIELQKVYFLLGKQLGKRQGTKYDTPVKLHYRCYIHIERMHSDLVETRPSLKSGSLEFSHKGLLALQKAEEDDIKRREEIGERITAMQQEKENATRRLTKLFCEFDKPKTKPSPNKYS